ncbi:unnamed protein product [Meloidogyne enterolobii]|uniref:Uncharacterized protein n=1 Tax=Meloidogyne enterolobii TaxID=390850 RepID=A0ACB0YQ38_MELEN
MIIIRCWLEQLLKCAFVYAFFNINVLNPELINILFNNDKSIQFNFQKLFIFASNKTFESVLKFSLNHLTISESLHICLDNVDITEQDTKFLYNILINEGNKFPKIRLRSSKLRPLYDIMIEYITTSRDFSKMVTVIDINLFAPPSFKLNERAEKIEIKQINYTKYTNYQIANIHNPKVRFSLCNKERDDGIIFCIQISKMTE